MPVHVICDCTSVAAMQEAELRLFVTGMQLTCVGMILHISIPTLPVSVFLTRLNAFEKSLVQLSRQSSSFVCITYQLSAHLKSHKSVNYQVQLSSQEKDYHFNSAWSCSFKDLLTQSPRLFSLHIGEVTGYGLASLSQLFTLFLHSPDKIFITEEPKQCCTSLRRILFQLMRYILLLWHFT